MNEKKQSGQLKQVIGLFGGISLVAGMTIGSGVYYLGSYVLERTDSTSGWPCSVGSSEASYRFLEACALRNWALPDRCPAV